MAKNLKRSIAMLLVLNMLTGMIPVQALADEGNAGATDVVITIEAPAEKSEPAPAEKQESAPAEKTESAPVETASAEVDSYQAESSGEESSDKDVKNDVIDVETSSGKTEKVEVEVTTEKTENEDGSETVKTEVVVENFKTESGALVDFIGVGDMTTDEEGTTRGNVHEEYLVVKGRPNGDVYIAEGGYELTLEDKEIGEDVTVDIPLTDKEGENENTAFGGAETGEQVGLEGEKPEEGDGKFEYTEVTVVEQGSVTITTTEIEFEEKIDLENTDMDHVVSDTTPTDDNDLVYVGQADDMYLPGYEGEILPPEGSLEDDYAYTYVGNGNTSMFVPAIVFTEPMTDEEKLAAWGDKVYLKPKLAPYFLPEMSEEVKATIAYDENGGYVTDADGYILTKDGTRLMKSELTSKSPDGSTVYLHRIDLVNNTYYQVEGWFEDGEWVAELNGDEQFRTIWAGPQQFILVDDKGNLVTTYCADFATPTQDNFGYNVENLEDATYYSEEEARQIRAIAENGYWGTASGFGSLDEMKAKLAEAGFTAEELESLNDGVALTATQIAIWSCSNKMNNLEFINAYYSAWGVGKGVDIPEDKEDEVKLMFKLYDYLMNLQPSEVEGTTADTIINADNFIDNMNVTVIEKAKDHENNQDDNRDNDAYVTNLTFALVVEPSTENGDDLVVRVIGSDGTVIASGRVAGEYTEEDAANGMVQLEKGEDNNYTFSGITMVEGEHNFNLTLEGIQNLKEGVYLYSSEVVDETSSQTLVGVSGGERAVNVSMNIKFELDVKETVVAREHVWRNETIRDNPPPPAQYRMARGVGQLEIIEEEVPLAAPPQTGDMSILWFAMILMSGCGLCILNLLEKRKCRA